jgi:hypothetical protein
MLKSKEIAFMMSMPMSSQDGNLGIHSRNAPPHLPHLGHQMTGRTIDEVESLSFVVNHVLAVIPLISRSSVLMPGGVLVTIPSVSVGKIGIVGGVGSVAPGPAQKYDISQPNGKRASVVGIGSPKNGVGSKHFGSETVQVDGAGMGLGREFAQNNGISQPSGKKASVVDSGIPVVKIGTVPSGSENGDAVDESTIELIECPDFGDQAEVTEPDVCVKASASVVETENAELGFWSGPFHDGS